MTKRTTTTTQELNGTLARLNSIIEPTGKKVAIEHRNNYTAIDLLNADNTGEYIASGLTDKGALSYLRAMLKGIELKNAVPVKTTLTTAQIESLQKSIYTTLVNFEEVGMGEAGDCNDEAARIVSEWMKANNIEEQL